MINDEEFDKAQIILQKIGRTHTKAPKTTKVGDLIKMIAISPKHDYIKSNGVVRPAQFFYEERTRYYCVCGKRFYDNKNPKEYRYCQKKFDEKTKKSVDQRFYVITNSVDNNKKPIAGKSKKMKSISLEPIIKNLEKELDKLVITDGLFQVCRKRLFTLWLEAEKEIKKKLNALKKQEEKLEAEASNLCRKQFDENAAIQKKKTLKKPLEGLKMSE